MRLAAICVLGHRHKAINKYNARAEWKKDISLNLRLKER